MLSKLGSDHFTHVVDRLDIYTTLRFVATCTTVRTATKERVDNRPEMVLKTVALRLVDDFAARFNATPGLEHTRRVEVGRVVNYGMTVTVVTNKVNHIVSLHKTATSKELLKVQFDMHSHRITVFLHVRLLTRFARYSMRRQMVEMFIWPRTEVDGTIKIDEEKRSTYSAGLGAFLRERGFV